MLKFKLIKFLLIGSFCFCLLGSINSLKAEENNKSNLKVLVITGIHDYDTTGFNTMIESFSGMDCTIKEMGKDPGTLFEKVDQFPYDAIVLYNFNQRLSVQHRENFKAILKKGVGLTVIHHAIAGFPEWIEFEEIIGATYVLKEQTRGKIHYPRPKWKQGDINIKVEDSEHPITLGINDFTIHDESYKDWVYHDGNNLLLTTDNKESNYQIAWTRSSFGARVFYIQLGHDKHSFENVNYRKLLQQGIEWRAKRRK